MSANTRPDHRINLYRDDIAAAHLRGEVEAANYVDGEDMQVRTPVAPVLRNPQSAAPMETQLLFGEIFRVYEEKDGWAFGQSALDDYVGYVDVSTLAPRLYRATHTVAALRTFIFPKPDMKTRPAVPVGLNAKVRVTGAQGDYSEIERGGFIFTAHLAPVGAHVRAGTGWHVQPARHGYAGSHIGRSITRTYRFHHLKARRSRFLEGTCWHYARRRASHSCQCFPYARRSRTA